MPWCPNCKTEYREGITVCNDCNVDLVEELPEDINYVPFFEAERKGIADKLAKYFEYSELKSTIEYDEENGVYVLSIPSDKEKQAKKLYQAFYFVERERQEKDANDTEEKAPKEDGKSQDESSDTGEAPVTSVSSEVETQAEAEESGAVPEAEAVSGEEEADTEAVYNPAENVGDYDDIEDFDKEASLYNDYWNNSAKVRTNDEPATYVMKADRYKDYNATVWVFLVTGIIGFILVILNTAKVLSFLNGPLPLIVSALLFLSFIYIGLSTNTKAKKLQAEIEEENKLTDEINKWLKENVTDDFINSLHDGSISDELNYINTTEAIKKKLMEKFGNQNPAYLDCVIENFYSENYDVNSGKDVDI